MTLTYSMGWIDLRHDLINWKKWDMIYWKKVQQLTSINIILILKNLNKYDVKLKKL